MRAWPLFIADANIMTKMSLLWIAITAMLLASAPVNAAEAWSCIYSGFGDPSFKVQAMFRVRGQLLEEVSTSNAPYRILANDGLAIVAAKGGALPAFMVPEHGTTIGGSILIIKKDTGDFVLGNVAWHINDPAHMRTTGTCRRSDQ